MICVPPSELPVHHTCIILRVREILCGGFLFALLSSLFLIWLCRLEIRSCSKIVIHMHKALVATITHIAISSWCPIVFAIVYRYLQKKDCPHHKKTLPLLSPSCWAQHLDPKSKEGREHRLFSNIFAGTRFRSLVVIINIQA